jgi:hypothetical protein
VTRLPWFWFFFTVAVLLLSAMDRYHIVSQFKQRERVVIIDPAPAAPHSQPQHGLWGEHLTGCYRIILEFRQTDGDKLEQSGYQPVRKSHCHGLILWENAAMNHINQSSMTDGVRCERLVVAEEIWG